MQDALQTATKLPSGMMLTPARIKHEAQVGQWPNRLLTDFLADTLKRAPDSTALICPHSETTLSHRALDKHASNIAGNLAALGVAKGDVVSFQLPNWWQFVALHLACLKLGAISNPLMPIFRARELEFMLPFACSKVLIVPDQFQHFDHAALGDHLKRTIPSLEHLFVVGGAGLSAFDTLLRPCAKPPPNPQLSANDVVLLLFTSGTTGRPKGVLHTSNTLLTSARHVADRMGLGPSDVGFMPAPFAHMIGFNFGMNMALMLGLPLVLLDRWTPEAALDLIARHRVSYTAGSTPFMADLANVPDMTQRNLTHFKMFMTAGAPIMEPVIENVTSNLGVSVLPGWGMTEVVQATSTQPIAALDKPLTDGAAFPGNEVRIIDGAGNSCPTGQSGHLQFRGSTLFVGYLNQPELYVLDRDGWFDTGDLARMDAAGEIRITGREKDILIRGGENIPVLEVESLICQLDAVCDVALVGMPDARLGERGCLFVVLKDGGKLDFDDMVAHLNRCNLARQYFPERLEILPEMPRTASGKIQKFILRERAADLALKEGQTWQNPTA
ncbi:MAG: AMP-binding protein [Alphaproteobacteria bacterium]|nr:AMP-binding protein [Alphaproteobacteria bacterium]